MAKDKSKDKKKVNALAQLKKYFNIGVKDVGGNKKIIFPYSYKDGNNKPVEIPSELQQFYNYWLTQCHDNDATLSDRFGRYKDIDWMEEQEPIISTALQMYPDEATQADGQGYILTVKGKKDVVSYINKKFKDWKLNQNTLREMCYNLAKYGDAFWINVFKENEGITEIILLDPRQINDILEFDPVKVKQDYSTNKWYGLFRGNRTQSLSQIADMMDKGLNCASDYYRRYLLGYVGEGNDIYFAPYQISHCRMYTTKTEFYPYGRPILINAISPYRQFKIAKDLMVMSRASGFPKEIFTIKANEEMSEMDMWDVLNEVRENYKKLGVSPQTTDSNMSIGGQIWTIEDLFSYDLKDSKGDLDDIADIENLELEIMRPTGIPLDYLKQDGGWSNNSSLLTQSKIFARKIFSVQSALLEQLVNMIKMDFIVSGNFDVDTDFELSMNFPVTEADDDKLGLMGDQMSMAKDIIDNISASLGLERDEAMPFEIVRDIYNKFSFLNDVDLKRWYDIYLSSKANNNQEETKKKVFKRLNETVVWGSYFKAKRDNGVREGVEGKKHFITSNYEDENTEYKLMLLNEDYKVKGKNTRLHEKFKEFNNKFLVSKEN